METTQTQKMETVRVNFEGNCYKGTVERYVASRLQHANPTEGDWCIVNCDDGIARAFTKDWIVFEYSRIDITYTDGGMFYGAYLYDGSNRRYRKKLSALRDLNAWLLTRNVQKEVEVTYDEDKLSKICGELLWKHGMTATYNDSFDPS